VLLVAASTSPFSASSSASRCFRSLTHSRLWPANQCARWQGRPQYRATKQAEHLSRGFAFVVVAVDVAVDVAAAVAVDVNVSDSAAEWAASVFWPFLLSLSSRIKEEEEEEEKMGPTSPHHRQEQSSSVTSFLGVSGAVSAPPEEREREEE